MSDTTVKKVDSSESPTGTMGQIYLASGKRLSMRLWDEEPGDKEGSPSRSREYETVGYVLEGKAELELEGQTVTLAAGDSWVVPAGSEHRYTVLERFKAVEATSPPADVQGRDEAPAG